MEEEPQVEEDEIQEQLEPPNQDKSRKGGIARTSSKTN
jgi:hypothetical protein